MQTSRVIVVALLLGVICNVAFAKGKKNKECKYSRGSWSECDENTQTKTLTKTLKDGSGQGCEATKIKTKKCEVGQPTNCLYKRVPWGECDEATQLVSRTRHLKKKADSSCAQTKVETKPCADVKEKCKYVKSDWSECVSGKKSKTMTLKAEKSGSGCDATKTVQKKC